jgi:hopanoid-associated phosphorylase
MAQDCTHGGWTLAAVGMLREARLVEGPNIKAVAGGGRSSLLLQRLQAAADGAGGVLSIGLGGALDPQLKVGDVVIASEVISDGVRWPVDEAWSDRLAAALPPARRAVLYGSEAMILTGAHKERLHGQTGAALADMESHTAAEFATQRGLPFAGVRVVSDSASSDLPRAVTAGMKPNGGMNLIGVLAALAADPRQLPALMRAGREAEIAFRVLADLAGKLRP